MAINILNLYRANYLLSENMRDAKERLEQLQYRSERMRLKIIYSSYPEYFFNNFIDQTNYIY